MAERRVGIITDACADLPSTEELRSIFGVGPIVQTPLWVNFEERSFRAGVDLNNKLFKELLKETGEIPTTAASPPVVFFEEYKKLTDNGLEIVSIHVGDNLSATGANARLAVQKLGSDKVTVYDSDNHKGTGTVSMAQGLMVIEAERAAAKGAGREEITAAVDDVKRRTKLRGVTPNIPFLWKSGRASTAEGIFGVIGHIIPILQIDNEVVKTVHRTTTMRKTLDWLVDFAREQGPLERAVIVDFEAGENPEILKSRLIKEADVPEARIYRGELGQLTGSHSGPGTFALIMMRKG